MFDIDSISMGMHWSKLGATHYDAQLGLTDKGQVIKQLSQQLRSKAFAPTKQSGLGCYQPSPEV